MPLENRIALITGGRRIGQVVAEELARAGADVALSYRSSRAEAEETVTRVRALGRRAIVLQADVSRPADCATLAQGIEQQLGGLDIVVNMASTYVSRPLEEIDEHAWRADIDNNLSSAFHVTHAVLPLLRRRSPAHVVNFTDWLPASGRPRYTGFVAYYVAKAGVKALTEALALELAKDRILVNAIAPGPIVPPPELDAEQAKAVAEATPLGRWGGELEIARAVMLLVTTQFITGETLRVDGGRHVR
ncbi:3-oxoacyl-[acyl-carrier-protein] reductase FabG [Luteitalea pratensis]|uniref:3-oxoacyl-[acyl-carrier-protein] reductase FabG n=1 Tax=Luteitalea pratensis TaxID=1855912 RepID=A0A143PWY0_LUTPR|nr:SDR family oxidoreductase [Luteitalea pratensis]AMY12683.1 3-oxoacyl-[acyl-carrier-protein] reductase FabG [Luteitalea pratensis]